MLEARVKKSYTYSRTTACGGHEFVKGEWRPVPKERENEARETRRLEVRKYVAVEEKVNNPSAALVKAAKKAGIDLATLEGSGKDGTVVMQDVKDAATNLAELAKGKGRDRNKEDKGKEEDK